jgi:hypothetical protein
MGWPSVFASITIVIAPRSHVHGTAAPPLRKPHHFHTTARNHDSNHYVGALDVSTALTGPIRVKIVCALKSSEFEPFDVSKFEVGNTYEVGPKLGALLIVSGCAEPEKRSMDGAAVTSHPSDRKR